MKKQRKFETGDKVVCVNKDGFFPDDGSVNGFWIKRTKIEIGDVGTVTSTRSTGSVKLDNSNDYILNQRHFELQPDAVIIVLRRPADAKAIEKFLKEKGYDDTYGCGNTSRIRVVHLSGRHKKTFTINAQGGFSRGTKAAIANTIDFVPSIFGHKNFKVIKTKPSVKKAIIELEKFI